MNTREFRHELLKLMPGYKWTVHKPHTPGKLQATGIKTSGFNRLSTLSVTRKERDRVLYEVRSSGFGVHAPWLGYHEDTTLARALRNLQNFYEKMAGTYWGHAAELQSARPADGSTPAAGGKADRPSELVRGPAGAAASKASGAPREADHD